MKRTISTLCLVLLFSIAFCQTAPAHLKHFGFAMIDVGWDDPHDATNITNYIAEVDSFSNVAQLGVFNYTDNIVARTNLMNSKCVKPILSIQSIFFYEIDTLAPSGHHFQLYSNYQARWNTFKATNSSVLDSSKVASFYVSDEPVWNGIDFPELDAVCQLIKNDFPEIPIMLIEAYPVLNNLVIPTTADWVGFDRYAIFDPSSNPLFLNDLDTLKSKISNINQKIFLIIDDQWLPFYGAAGFPPDTVRYMVQNYYNLAASDPSIIGLIGYLWAGGLDNPGQLGVRDMPQSVINKNIEIGKMIKANQPYCGVSGIDNSVGTLNNLIVYPNPANDYLLVKQAQQNEILQFVIYNELGEKIKEGTIAEKQIDIQDLHPNLYLLQLTDGFKSFHGKFVKE